MGRGNPIEQRPPIIGTKPGDRIVCRGITAREYDRLGADATRRELDRLRREAPEADMVVLAVPPGRAGDITRALAAYFASTGSGLPAA